MKNRGTAFLLVTGIIVLINLLSLQFYTRLDLTENKQYTLSAATKSILRNMDQTVSVKAFFSENLPPDLKKVRDDFRDMLLEYSSLSRGNVDYAFVNPNEDPDAEQEAMQQGISPVLINVREKDQTTQQRAYMGAILTLGEQQEVLPFISTQTPMEYTLTTAIKKMSVVHKPPVGYIQGHGEPGLHDIMQAVQALSVVFSVENIFLDAGEPISDRFRTLIWINPRDSVPPAHFEKIDDYLTRGGRMVVAVNAVEGDFQTARGNALESSLFPWLLGKGLEIEPSFVIDASCGSVTVQQRQGFFTINTPVQFPFLPLINEFPEHPVTTGISQVLLQFASPLKAQGEAQVSFTPLIRSSHKSGVIRAPTFFDVSGKRWTDADFPMRHITIGGLLEAPAAGGPGSRMIVFADGDFALSPGGRAMHPDNVNLLVNSVEWLSDDTGLTELRTKAVYSRPIKELEENKRKMIKTINFALPMLLAVGYGIYRLQRNRTIRLRRMHERYV